MKSQRKQSNPKTYSKEIERWAKEDVLQLANHFHKLNNNQYERTHDFTMNQNDLERFKDVKEAISKLYIYMALDENDKTKHTFFPVLKVIDEELNEHHFKLYPASEKQPTHGESEIVPEIFKNMICKNWDEIDFHLIDDLFFARKKEEVNGQNYESTVRVLYFEICEEIIEEVIKQLTEITGITLYSGIDMNKFSDKYQISFTPVLGFQHENQNAEKQTFGMKSILEFSKGEVFVEYSSPCPPTC